MKNGKYLTQRAIIKSRGWSKRLIDKYLVTPDKSATNPYYATGPQMKLYYVWRVIEVENDDAFKVDYLQTQERKEAGKLASETYKNKLEQHLIEWLNKVEKKIKIVQMPVDKLIKKAIKHYNTIHAERIDEGEKVLVNFKIDEELIEKFTDIECDQIDVLFLRRITMNYLRHNFNQYDVLLEESNIKYWKEEAYTKMKSIIQQRIFEKYPYLEYY